MPARGNVVLTDAETTPVDHTFTPQKDIGNDVVQWRNLNATVPAASELFTCRVRDSSATGEDISTPGKKVSPRSVEMRLNYPSTFTDPNSLELVDFTDVAIVQFLVHPRSTQQRCKNLKAMIVEAITAQGNLLNLPVETGEHIW